MAVTLADQFWLTHHGQESAVVRTLDAPAERPIPRVGSATAALNKDALYLFSGRGGPALMPIEENGALWCYTPSQSLWELVKPADPSAPYPAGRSYHALASDGDRSIYLHAGCPEKGRMSDLWVFDVESKTWSELPAAPAPPRGGTSIAVCNGNVYRMNGFDGTSEQGGAIDVYDIGNRTWSTISFVPDGRRGPEPRSVSGLVAVKVKGRDLLLTLFGERDPSSLGHAGAGKMLADVWVFDIKDEEWTKVEASGDAPLPRGWFGTDVMQDQDGKHVVIVHGGLAEDNSRLGDVWKLQFV
jgi:N-acetylneuraminic acid mutarotase